VSAKIRQKKSRRIIKRFSSVGAKLNTKQSALRHHMRLLYN
jgi:hypothetical protein